MKLNILQHLCVFIIRAYQIILSPLLGGQCRFSPTCSEYGIGCIECHGCIKGLVLITKRLLKCHPFHPGGYDPVPQRHSCVKTEIS